MSETHTTPKKQTKEMEIRISYDKNSPTYKWYVSNLMRHTMTVMDPNSLNMIIESNPEKWKQEFLPMIRYQIQSQLKGIYLGENQGRFVAIDMGIFESLKRVSKELENKKDIMQEKIRREINPQETLAIPKITEVVFTKNLNKNQWVIAPFEYTQENLRGTIGLELLPSTTFKDSYGTIENYTSGYNFEEDPSNYAEQFSYTHLLKKNEEIN